MNTVDWEATVRRFSPKEEEAMDPDVADNRYIAWPVMQALLFQGMEEVDNNRVIDFGCGGGIFASLLAKDFEVLGVDSSKEMIAQATKSYGKTARFLVGDSSTLPSLGPAGGIVSSMVLQFVNNDHIEAVMQNFSQTVQKEGTLVIAVHNPEFVKAWIHAGIRHVGYDSATHPIQGFITFGDTRIPIFIRSAEQYNELAARHGFAPVGQPIYPPFTEEFLAKYPMGGPTEHSEYLIQAYKKVA